MISSYVQLLTISLLFLTGAGAGKTSGNENGGRPEYSCYISNGYPAGSVTEFEGVGIGRPNGYNTEEGRTFIINTCIRDLGEFKNLVRMAARLKPYGKVQVNISTLADKGFYEIPTDNSPWHEYAGNKQTPYKFFPDPKIAPFIPADFVKKNRQLLLEKAKILRDNGMDAAFFGSEPNILPAAFFEAYPELRGPRVDHPRRSNREAFSPCTSVKETRDMYASMMAEMLKEAPEIKSFYFKTNDAGAGICWSDWLYSGPNGPGQCKDQSEGERVEMLLNAFKEGAEKAGRPITIYMSADDSNFSDQEKKDVAIHLPANAYFEGYHTPEIINTGSLMGLSYPVTGIINPQSFISKAKSVTQAKTVIVNLGAAYDRGYERVDVFGFLIDMIEKQFQSPLTDAPGAMVAQLKELCVNWVGKDNADRLLNAFNALDEAIKYKNTAMPRVSALYWGVSTRQITRPLLIVPQKLGEQEEAYFLPFVFNVSKEEGRTDYMDIHGGRQELPAGMAQTYAAKIIQVATLLEGLDAAAARKAFFRNMATGLRIYASIMRSCGNFAEAQVIRDRNAAKFTNPVHRPGKEPSWTGDADFIRFNDIMRDELDNTRELIVLLEKGGIELVCHSKDPSHEDTFLLGADLTNQLKKKRKIMLDHWRDIEGYLASPFK